jgi:benzoyl-CoA reductase/2-hydroxyglutaryl-CoA dehydratase subunit BcrC/BadD/HgdB
MPDIYQVVEASGGRVVWDDFCTGARYFEGDVDETGPPLDALTEKYLQRVVCPAKHAGIYSRAAISAGQGQGKSGRWRDLPVFEILRPACL